MGVRIGLMGFLAIWLASCGEANSVDATVEARLAAVEQDIDAMVQATVEALSVSTPTPTSDVSSEDTSNDTPVTSLTYVPTATPGSTPSPVETQAPTSTPQPTPTLIPTHTPRPTSTPLPPATATPVPTPTLISTPTPVPTPSSVQELVQRSLPSIARIATVDGSGTGFVYAVNNTKAYIVTNAHVVEGVSEVTIEINDETYAGQMLGADDIRDIAVVSVCCGKFRPLRFSDEEVGIGQEVVAIGYALGLEGDPSVTRGIVSAIRGWGESRESTVNVIQTDTPINRGNSGGPLLALDGSVVGMSTWKVSGGTTEAVGFAVVSDAVRVRASALANPATMRYAGRQFVRVGGPVNLVIRGDGETAEFSSSVRAKNFIVESKIVDLEQRVDYIVFNDFDDQNPYMEGFSIRAVGCAHMALTKTGESLIGEGLRAQDSSRWLKGNTVRLAVVDSAAVVYVDGQRFCQTTWEFGRIGTIALLSNVGNRYVDYSIWTESE